jgi:hypothetical protein
MLECLYCSMQVCSIPAAEAAAACLEGGPVIERAVCCGQAASSQVLCRDGPRGALLLQLHAHRFCLLSGAAGKVALAGRRRQQSVGVPGNSLWPRCHNIRLLRRRSC